VKNKTLIWSSDFSSNTGEGQLAKTFIKYMFKYNKKINKNKKNFIIKKSLINKNKFIHKYIEPTIFAFKSIFLQKKFKNIIFCNYLPLWNFLIFLFLPSRTILGPITGGIYIGKVRNFKLFIRKYIFPFFYRLSLRIIFLKFNKVIFSTNILEQMISKKNTQKCLFNFVLVNLSLPKKQKIKKKYFLIFYNRNHETKKNNSYLRVINEISFKEKVLVLGNQIDIENKNIIHKNFIPKKKLIPYLKSCIFTFASPENLYSFFSIDAYNSGCLIIHQKNSFKKLTQKSKNFVSLDLLRKINIKSLKKHNFDYKDENFYSKILKKRKKIINFISNY